MFSTDGINPLSVDGATGFEPYYYGLSSQTILTMVTRKTQHEVHI
jgi:hypothetical protein